MYFKVKGKFLHKRGNTKKLYDLIESGDKPTIKEIAEFLYGEYNVKTRGSANRTLHQLRTYYRNSHGVLFGAVKENKVWRHQKIEESEQIVAKGRVNSAQAIANHKSLIFKQNMDGLDPQGRSELRECILITQKQIIEDELISLKQTNDDDTKYIN